MNYTDLTQNEEALIEALREENRTPLETLIKFTRECIRDSINESGVNDPLNKKIVEGFNNLTVYIEFFKQATRLYSLAFNYYMDDDKDSANEYIDRLVMLFEAVTEEEEEEKEND